MNKFIMLDLQLFEIHRTQPVNNQSRRIMH